MIMFLVMFNYYYNYILFGLVYEWPRTSLWLMYFFLFCSLLLVLFDTNFGEEMKIIMKMKDKAIINDFDSSESNCYDTIFSKIIINRIIIDIC